MLLTVCIPTYNRLLHVKKQLIAITHQIKKHKLEEKIQILIGENTNINNELLSNNYLSRFKKINLKIIRNKKNIGYAKNLINLILNAKGKFSWFLSDDDIIHPKALISIISAIEKNNNIDYFTFRCSLIRNGKNINKDLYFYNLPKTNKNNYVLMDGKQFLEKYWRSVIFLSLNVFNTQKMKTHLNKNKILKNINHVYQNSYLCISFINNSNVCIILSMILADTFPIKNYDLKNKYEVIVTSWIKLVEDLKCFHLPKITLIQMRLSCLRNLIYIFKYLIVNLIFFKNYNEIFLLLKKNKSSFIIESFLIFAFLLYVKISKYININPFFFNIFKNKFKNDIEYIKNSKIINKDPKSILTYNNS